MIEENQKEWLTVLQDEGSIHQKNNKRNVFRLIFICFLFTSIATTSLFTWILIQDHHKIKQLMLEIQSHPKDTTTEMIKNTTPSVVSVLNNGNKSTDSAKNIESSVGSGFVFNDNGYILTNYHVVESATSVTIRMHDAKELKAAVVNFDETLDLAVLKLKSPASLPPLHLGDSDNLLAGESVFAIGSPLGVEFQDTVTSGIVSFPKRNLDGGNQDHFFIQTDAAINPGNSGGPLLNRKGEVIGMNAIKLSSDNVEGIGFAIPINVIKTKISALLKPRFLIGIQGRPVEGKEAKQNNLPTGVYIVDVTPHSGAETAGLKTGDIITLFGGKRVRSIEDIENVKKSYKVGDFIGFSYYRKGTTMQSKVKLNPITP
jgi:serine protease Do